MRNGLYYTYYVFDVFECWVHTPLVILGKVPFIDVFNCRDYDLPRYDAYRYPYLYRCRHL